MNITLYQPTETDSPDLPPGTTTLENTTAFKVEFGSTNTVHVEYQDGEIVSYEGIGLTVSGGTLDSAATKLP